MSRAPIPDDTAVRVLFEHDHTCCVCNEPGRDVQIHHIDDDNENSSYENLSVLCLQDHNDTQIKGGFGRKLRAPEVIKYRDEWIRRVRERRELADRFIVERLALRVPPRVSSQSVWEPPGKELLAVYVNGLPDVLRNAVAQAEKIWDGDHEGIVPGTRLIIDVLSESWVQLASWIDPHHFAPKSANEYINEYVASRNSWNRMLIEPASYGSRARTGTIETLEYTLVDVQDAIERTATKLAASYLEDFDFHGWRKRWNKPKYIG